MENHWELVGDGLRQVEERLKQVVSGERVEVTEVGGYIFSNSGKRIRPGLFLLTAYRPGEAAVDLIDAAVAFELLHTASLLHDDVIDQAKLRRGKDALQVRWSNKIAVLTGDYLLSRSFSLLVGYRNWRLMDIIVSMVERMTEGEIEQAFAGAETTDLENRYFQWIGKKSASFFAACCRAGSLFCGERPWEQDRWAEFGFNLGIAFQLIDDLLDYTATGEDTGKPLFGDLGNRVITLPLIKAVEQSESEGQRIRSLLAEEPVEGNVAALSRIVLTGEGPVYTGRKAEEYVRKAVGILDSMQGINPEKKFSLARLAEGLLERRR